MKNKKLLKISFFLLLIALFTFLEWQIREEKGIEEGISPKAQQEIKEPVAHIAIER